LRLPCPACGALASAAAWEQDAHRRKAIAIRDKLPGPVAPLAFSYIAFFRSRKSERGLSWVRVERIMEQLWRLTGAGHVKDESKPARPTTPEMWAEGIGRMLDFPPRRLPLKNHNYLSAVVWDIADQADRKAESDRNYRERLRSQTGREKMEEPEKIDRDTLRKIRNERFKPARRRPAAGSGAEDEPPAVPDVDAEMAPPADGGAGASLHDTGPDGVDRLPAVGPAEAPGLLSGALGRVLSAAGQARKNREQPTQEGD